MVNQLLFGEGVTIMEVDDSKDWLLIAGITDGYTGWCQYSHIEQRAGQISETDPPLALASDWVNTLVFDDAQLHVPMGASLAIFEQDDRLVYTGSRCMPAEMSRDAATIEALAMRFLHTPYLWGGRSVFGVDCSGFTQMVFHFLGIALPRDAHQQAGEGTVVDFIQGARCGDLAFFDNTEERIMHTGILLDDRRIIHAAGKVRIDGIDHAGIVHSDTLRHTHRLRIIKRFL